MISLLIICLVRKYRLLRNRKEFYIWLAHHIRYYAFRIIAIVSILVIFSITLKAQYKQASYSIIRNGDVAGQLKFEQVRRGDSICLKTESEIKACFLYTITVFSREEAIYKNGILMYSSIYRKRNGSEKTNKQTRLRGNEYYITTKDKTEVARNYPIRNNLLSMYCCEPKMIGSIYSDYFEQYIPLEKVEESKYKISFPDGNYNFYYYKNNTCVGIDVHASLYTVQLVLNK